MIKPIFARLARSASLANIAFDIKNLCRAFPNSKQRSSECFAKLIENCILAVQHGASENDLLKSIGKGASQAAKYGASDDDIRELCACVLALMGAIERKDERLIDSLYDDVNSLFISRTGEPISEEYVAKGFSRWGIKSHSIHNQNESHLECKAGTGARVEPDGSREIIKVMDSIQERLASGQIVNDLKALQRNHDAKGVQALLDAIETIKSALEIMEQCGLDDENRNQALNQAICILREQNKYRI